MDSLKRLRQSLRDRARISEACEVAFTALASAHAETTLCRHIDYDCRRNAYLTSLQRSLLSL